MKRLSGDYIRGYTKAIKDIEDAFCCVQEDLSRRKMRWNYKLIVRLLELFLRYRENFRENRGGFIRWNTKLNNLEFFEGDGGSR